LAQYRTRQLSYAIAMEIHPICNASVGAHVAEITGGGEEAKTAWMRHYITKGLIAVEALLAAGPETRFCNGETPGMADCCLIPQLYNADRWGVSTADWPHITRIAAACASMQAFATAHPDAVNLG
jgi:maleylacetoacetate isomerase